MVAPGWLQAEARRVASGLDSALAAVVGASNEAQQRQAAEAAAQAAAQAMARLQQQQAAEAAAASAVAQHDAADQQVRVVRRPAHFHAQLPFILLSTVLIQG
jgi:hypothetical protein